MTALMWKSDGAVDNGSFMSNQSSRQEVSMYFLCVRMREASLIVSAMTKLEWWKLESCAIIISQS